MKQKFRKNLKS